MPLNQTLKNGSNSKFYVVCISSQFKEKPTLNLGDGPMGASGRLPLGVGWLCWIPGQPGHQSEPERGEMRTAKLIARHPPASHRGPSLHSQKLATPALSATCLQPCAPPLLPSRAKLRKNIKNELNFSCELLFRFIDTFEHSQGF